MIKRWDRDGLDDPDGIYVTYDDYRALEAKLNAAENSNYILAFQDCRAKLAACERERDEWKAQAEAQRIFRAIYEDKPQEGD